MAIRDPYSPDDPTTDSNDPNNTANAGNSVNAANTTVKMQETGVPLNLMVLAILMVLGGLIQTKRK